MAKNSLNQADREAMDARGWDPENAALASRYMELRGEVSTGRRTENDLNYEMNKADNAEKVKENAAVRPEAEINKRPESEKDNRIRELAERFSTEQKTMGHERDREHERD